MASLQEVAKMEGVKDLPAKVKVKFCKALIAESEGRYQEAHKYLDEAIEASNGTDGQH